MNEQAELYQYTTTVSPGCRQDEEVRTRTLLERVRRGSRGEDQHLTNNQHQRGRRQQQKEYGFVITRSAHSCLMRSNVPAPWGGWRRRIRLPTLAGPGCPLITHEMAEPRQRAMPCRKPETKWPANQ